MSWSYGLWHWISGHQEAAIAAAGAVATVVLWLFDHRRQHCRLSYRVHMNAPIGATWDMRNLGDFVIRGGEDGQRIPDASLVLISVANSGRVNVTEKDFAAPMRFAFDGRKVKGFEVFEMSPPELADTLRPGQAASTANVGVTFDEDKLFVPPVTLNAGERFKLLVLLSGTGHSVNGGAHIRGGKFIPGNNAISARRTPHNPMRSRRICG